MTAMSGVSEDRTETSAGEMTAVSNVGDVAVAMSDVGDVAVTTGVGEVGMGTTAGDYSDVRRK